jgi:hypothetical protein
MIITDPTVPKPTTVKHDGDISIDEWRVVQENTSTYSMLSMLNLFVEYND